MHSNNFKHGLEKLNFKTIKKSHLLFILFSWCFGPFFLLSPSVEANEDEPDFQVYYNETITFFDNDGNLTPDGVSQKFLEEFFLKSGLTYKKVVLPWGRIMRETSRGNNALIFQFIRTNERESNFNWLLPFASEGEEVYLYNRSTPELNTLSKDEIISKNFKAICERNTAQCEMLLRFGFKDENIIRVPLSKTMSVPELLLRGRGDFMAHYNTSFEQSIDRRGLNKNLFSASHKLPVLSYYVAGSKDMSADLLKRIISARDEYWIPGPK